VSRSLLGREHLPVVAPARTFHYFWQKIETANHRPFPFELESLLQIFALLQLCANHCYDGLLCREA